MTSTIESGKSFEFVFSLPIMLQGFLLAFSVPLLAVSIFLLIVILPRLAPGSPNLFPILALALGAAGGFAFLVRLVFPPARWCARLEIERDRILFCPRSEMRFIGKCTEVHIEPNSTEILLCRSYSQGLSQGTRVIVRGPLAKEREIKIDYLVALSSTQFQRLTDGITAATGLPVRMVLRRFPVNGTVEETPWIVAHRAVLQSLLGLTLAMLPYIGGLTVGLIKPPIAVMILIGAALWLVSILATILIARIGHPGTKLPAAHLLITVFTFAASYAFSVVIPLYIFNSH